MNEQIVYCVGCKAKVIAATELTYESKQTSRGIKRFVKTTCSKGHKVTNIVKKENTTN